MGKERNALFQFLCAISGTTQSISYSQEIELFHKLSHFVYRLIQLLAIKLVINVLTIFETFYTTEEYSRKQLHIPPAEKNKG